jgi:hypothetical protein
MSTVEYDEDDDLSQISEGDLSFGEDDDDISYSSEESVDEKQRMPSKEEKSNQLDFTASVDSSSSLPISVLNDSSFAPAPEIPEKLENSRVLAKDAPSNASALPNWKSITHSGFILARISARSKIMKKWNECFWITYGESKVLLFRSKSDFDEWASNPYLTQKERNFLVKLSVDFVDDYENDIYMLGYQVSKQKQKRDKHTSEDLHQFKLQKKMDDSIIVIAFFSSMNESEVKALRMILIELAKRHQSSRSTTIKRTKKA